MDMEKRSSNCVILHIKGRLYMATVPEVESRFQTLLPICSRKKVVLNLSETIYVSSDGWRFFLNASHQVSDRGGHFLLAGMKEEVLDAFEILEFSGILRHFPSLSDALKANPSLPSRS